MIGIKKIILVALFALIIILRGMIIKNMTELEITIKVIFDFFTNINTALLMSFVFKLLFEKFKLNKLTIKLVTINILGILLIIFIDLYYRKFNITLYNISSIFTFLLFIYLFIYMFDKYFLEKNKEDKAKRNIIKGFNDEIATIIFFYNSEKINSKALINGLLEISSESIKKINFIEYDVDTELGYIYKQRYLVKKLPVFIFLDNGGNEFYRHNGYISYSKLNQILSFVDGSGKFSIN